jgi:1,4-alpha-glucan branching enzyme
MRRIGFTYFNSKCKKVELIGDFNKWVPEPMEQINEKQWAIAVAIAPGDYGYNFIVDGRPIKDPNNPKVCDVGRGFPNSLLKVKSLKEH